MESHGNFNALISKEFHNNDQFKDIIITAYSMYENLLDVIDNYPLLLSNYNKTLLEGNFENLRDYLNGVSGYYLYDWILQNISIKKEIEYTIKKDDLLSYQMFDSLNELGNEVLKWFQESDIYI